MADLPKDSPVESGENPIMEEAASPQTNGIDNAPAMDESSSGQSDTNQDKGIAVRVDADDSQPTCEVEDEIEHEHAEAGGNGKATNDTAHDAPNNTPAPQDGMAGDAVDTGFQAGFDSKPKKKKKKPVKKQGAVARKGVTGFEEFYADAPMTPTEAAHEKNELYSQSKSFPERIEQCIQRYRASRRMDTERTMLFNKYLWLGGIDGSQRQFTGFSNDREAIADANAEAIRDMTATDFIGGNGSRFFDPAYQELWEIDFSGIVKGFLSRVVPSIYMYDEKANKLASDLIKNFLNYVLMHDVCPEHNDDIEAAKMICERAPIDMRFLHEFCAGMPGPFNTLCTELFCDGEAYKFQGETEGDLYDKLVKFRVIVQTSAQQWIQSRHMRLNDPTLIRIVKTTEETYKVCNTHRPEPEATKVVVEELEKAGYRGNVTPLGQVDLQKSIIDYGYSNEVRPGGWKIRNLGYQEFLLEEDLLNKLDKGVKIRVVVCELNIGLRFIKEILDIRVEWDLFLPQMLMENWKDPVPNERPPPSVANPNVEEKAMAAQFAAEEPQDL
ncbi:Argonaute siRNA chaperone complex subunit Arb1-domain-containing protein [Rostrohypoxylon terebratum]|nr:Argonaute siRNA chaperone complex subunit Arb1-domain-containing protein [Rostrohypoxylon terebratum]